MSHPGNFGQLLQNGLGFILLEKHVTEILSFLQCWSGKSFQFVRVIFSSNSSVEELSTNKSKDIQFFITNNCIVTLQAPCMVKDYRSLQ